MLDLCWVGGVRDEGVFEGEDAGVGVACEGEQVGVGEEEFEVEVGRAHGEAAAVDVVDCDVGGFGGVLGYPEGFEVSL